MRKLRKIDYTDTDDKVHHEDSQNSNMEYCGEKQEQSDQQEQQEQDKQKAQQKLQEKQEEECLQNDFLVVANDDCKLNGLPDVRRF